MSMGKKSRPPLKTAAAAKEDPHKYRNPPKHSIESALVLPQKIQDEDGR
jgi:hypothetical protein